MDNLGDFLKSIEGGSVLYNLGPNQILLELILITTRNQVLLEHIIDELYPDDKELEKKLATLNEEWKKEALRRFMAIIARSKE